MSVYNPNVINTALSDDDIRRIAPSVFASEPHPSRSESYTFLSTAPILSALRREGFIPVRAEQSATRDGFSGEHARHMIRFRHDDGAVRRVGDVHAEVILRNSHDGSSSYELDSGLFRIHCLNGLVTSERNFRPVRIAHKGDVIGQVIEGSFSVLKESIRAVDVAESWKGIRLVDDERLAIAEGAHRVRFGTESRTPVRPDQLLSTRRPIDRASDLWTTINVVQENALRGGIHAIARDTRGRTRRSRTREIRGIDQGVDINQGIWDIGEVMAGLKVAA